MRRVGVLDRIALHAGIALITWSRRTRRTESRAELSLRYHEQVALLERQHAHLMMHLR